MNIEKFEIKNRWNGATMFALDVDASLPFGIKVGLAVKAGFASGAVLRGANLIGADLNVQSAGDINLASVDVLNNTLTGSLNAAGSFSTVNGVRIGSLTAGSAINIGTDIIASTITATTTAPTVARAQSGESIRRQPSHSQPAASITA